MTDEIMTIAPPTFFTLDVDGSLTMEWCMGGQGASDSWRVTYFHCPGEGVHVWDTRMDGSGRSYEGDDALGALSRLLAEAGKLS